MRGTVLYLTPLLSSVPVVLVILHLQLANRGGIVTSCMGPRVPLQTLTDLGPPTPAIIRQFLAFYIQLLWLEEISTESADMVTALLSQHNAAEPRVLILALVGITDALKRLSAWLRLVLIVTLRKPSGHMFILSSVLLV